MTNTFKCCDPSFLDCKNPAKSFKDVVSSSDSSNAFPYLKANNLWGLMALCISEEEVLHLAKLFDLALVGKFLLRRPVLDSIPFF
ncbi:hypothetical protein IEQ34_010510 [Dendrobium chrysotoxum]|uniref:Uncharacterized protein n=1 Tax=Dendrobium chrysotoxum TaxID=161865 RepID=A0AAV7GUZ9_DENCH|nr:hypothetical protein IEQ34_010510 [Dendrobium chrysotoxum]